MKQVRWLFTNPQFLSNYFKKNSVSWKIFSFFSSSIFPNYFKKNSALWIIFSFFFHIWEITFFQKPIWDGICTWRKWNRCKMFSSVSFCINGHHPYGRRRAFLCLVVKNNLNFKKIIINCIEKLGQRLEVESFQACSLYKCVNFDIWVWYIR